jgi:hypothetical protein
MIKVQIESLCYRVFDFLREKQIHHKQLNQAKNYKEALEMSQAKRNHAWKAAVNRQALSASCS